MVDFGLLLVCLAITGYIVMEIISKYNDERIRKEEYEQEKEERKIHFATKQPSNDKDKTKEEEKQPEYINPFELTQDILSGKKDIDEELKDVKQ